MSFTVFFNTWIYQPKLIRRAWWNVFGSDYLFHSHYWSRKTFPCLGKREAEAVMYTLGPDADPRVRLALRIILGPTGLPSMEQDFHEPEPHQTDSTR